MTDVLALAPPDEVGAADPARARRDPRAGRAGRAGAEDLRRLAAEVWRDYRRAIDGVGEQSRLPGV